MRCKQVVLLILLLSANANAQNADLFSDGDALLQRLGTVVGCDLSARLKADMQVMPLYSDASGVCELQIPVNSGQFYADAQCTEAVDFYRTGQQDFCDLAVDKQRLGNGASIEPGWTLSPGARYDVGVQSLEGQIQPYRKSVSYRTVSTDAGECQLEMRIYKNSLVNDAPTNGVPLLALHGGSWKARGFGTMGVESTAAHYTARGFVVFAPFYRLLSGSEPNVECQNASIEQIVSDVEFALQWVIANSADYGATGKPVVMGQSAGAHLALSVAVSQREKIAATLLMYPPTDFTNFIDLVLRGEYTDEQGLRIFSDVLGVPDASFADTSVSPVPENSFPALVQARPEGLPPMTIFHGLADELVPASQSVRLCNALAGRALAEQLISDNTLEQIIECGADSRLHLYALANHALDICLTGNELLVAACPAGGTESRRLIAASLDSTADEMIAIASAANNSASSVSTGGGTFELNQPLVWLLVFITAATVVRKHSIH